jgi:hypothetical protein
MAPPMTRQTKRNRNIVRHELMAATALEELTQRLARLAGAGVAEKIDALYDDTQRVVGEPRKWVPNPGPQTVAYFCAADVLLYGGQGGGGKSDLGLGLAFTAHRRSLILRRKYTNLSGLIDRAKEINGGSDGFNGTPPPKLLTRDGRLIMFGANQRPGDEQDFQGIPFDLKVFDEAAQFLETQIRFHIGWLRDAQNANRVRGRCSPRTRRSTQPATG